jgi:peptidoglycan-N-acetylglucosamine deacetylase
MIMPGEGVQKQPLRKGAVPPRAVLFLWPLIDRLLRAVYHIRPLRDDGSGIICFDLRRHKGPPAVLNDGSEVQTGDAIMEIHMNNGWLRARRKLNMTASRSAGEVLASYRHDLRLLAGQVADRMFGDVVALHGITLLHVGAKRLGFEVAEVPDSLWKKGASFYLAGVMQIFHLRAEGAAQVNGKCWELKEIWLSREALLTRYGTRHP